MLAGREPHNIQLPDIQISRDLSLQKQKDFSLAGSDHLSKEK